MNPILYGKFQPPLSETNPVKKKFVTPFQALASRSTLIKPRNQENIEQTLHKNDFEISNSNNLLKNSLAKTPIEKVVMGDCKETSLVKHHLHDTTKDNDFSEKSSPELYPKLSKNSEILQKMLQNSSKKPESPSKNLKIPETSENLENPSKNCSKISEKTPKSPLKNIENLDQALVQNPYKPFIVESPKSPQIVQNPEKLLKNPSNQKSEKKFINPFTNTITSITTEIKQDELYYEVIFTNKQRKKSISDDGILILSIKKFILLDSKGKQISESPNMLKVRSFRDGERLTIGLREIEIIKKIKRDDYISGRCFIQETIVEQIKPVQIEEVKQFSIPSEALVIDEESKVYIEPFLATKLRPHQREGVQFMYECVAGKRVANYFGCILADSMGLGKTLQAITLLYTLLRKDAPYNSFAKKGIIVAPATLVDN